MKLPCDSRSPTCGGSALPGRNVGTNMRIIHVIVCCCLAGILASSALAQTAGFDIAPFARRCCVQDQHTSQVAFDYEEARTAGQNAERAADGRYIYGVQWAEERDIKEVRVRVRAGSDAPQAEVEYWFRNWPYPPPQMPTIEDPVDDPWQGSWLKAPPGGLPGDGMSIHVRATGEGGKSPGVEPAGFGLPPDFEGAAGLFVRPAHRGRPGLQRLAGKDRKCPTGVGRRGSNGPHLGRVCPCL